MPMIELNCANFITKEFEPMLVNTAAIAWIKEIYLPGVPLSKVPWACIITLVTGEVLEINCTLAQLHEHIYWASVDAKPESLQRNPWGQK